MESLFSWGHVYKSEKERRLRTEFEHQYLRDEMRERRRMRKDNQKGQAKLQHKQHHRGEGKKGFQ